MKTNRIEMSGCHFVEWGVWVGERAICHCSHLQQLKTVFGIRANNVFYVYFISFLRLAHDAQCDLCDTVTCHTHLLSHVLATAAATIVVVVIIIVKGNGIECIRHERDDQSTRSTPHPSRVSLQVSSESVQSEWRTGRGYKVHMHRVCQNQTE